MGKKIDTQKFINHLQAKWQGRQCPMCGSTNWTVSENIFELRAFNDGNLVVGGGSLVPIIPVTCENCGNTVMVNAIKSGIIDQPEKKDDVE